MNRLIKVELLKARSTTATWILATAAVAICVMWTVVSVFTLDGAMNAGITADQRILNVYGMAQETYLFVLILGVLAMAGEYRHQTATWSFLATPRRSQVVAAKLAAYALIGLAIGVVAAAVTAAVAMPLLTAVGAAMTVPGILPVLLGSAGSTVLYAVFGVALGALIRNQLAGVIVAFLWFFYGEYLLVMLVPEVGRWVPGGAANALTGTSQTGGELLPVWGGGLLMLGYTLVLAVTASRFTIRRDVT